VLSNGHAGFGGRSGETHQRKRRQGAPGRPNLAEGKTRKQALRALKRQISDAIFACLQADARRARGPGGQPGNHSASRAAGSHPEHQLFGQATPGPGHHPTTAASIPGRAGRSSIAATSPPAKPQVQVERPQRSEDERPGGAARRRPYSATRKPREHRPSVTPQSPAARAAKKIGPTS
jgi:hypothetical protein